MKNNKELINIYLDIIKKAVLHDLYEEDFYIVRKANIYDKSIKKYIKNLVVELLRQKGFGLIRYKERSLEELNEGKSWPTFALTMIGKKRLENIQFCAEEIIKNNIKGDFIEAGVWRGGAVIFMKAIINANNLDKKVFVADSFKGLPKPNVKKYPDDKGDVEYKWDYLSVSLQDVMNNFTRFNLLDDNVVFLKGWFKDTLNSHKISKLSLIRLDGDMYESTWDSLNALYPKLQKGGFLIVDDYFVNQSCRKAVHYYFKKNNISHKIEKIDWTGAYFQK